MQVVRVSGTIKKAEEEAIRRARISIRRAQGASKKAKTLVTPNDAAPGPAQALYHDEHGDSDMDLGFANGIEDLDEPGDESEGE